MPQTEAATPESNDSRQDARRERIALATLTGLLAGGHGGLDPDALVDRVNRITDAMMKRPARAYTPKRVVGRRIVERE